MLVIRLSPLNANVINGLPLTPVWLKINFIIHQGQPIPTVKLKKYPVSSGFSQFQSSCQIIGDKLKVIDKEKIGMRDGAVNILLFKMRQGDNN